MTTAPALFVDSADRARVASFLEGGLVRGVTTNPTILERDGHRWSDAPALAAEWITAGARELFFQTWGEDAAEMHAHAAEIRAFGAPVGVKVPATRTGFRVAAELAADGAEVLLTAVQTPAQALAAAGIGVTYIAPYLGRLRDAGLDGDALVASMQGMCAGSRTEVLAASLRSPDDLTGLRAHGVNVFTAAPDVLDAVLFDAVTESSAAAFEDAMRRIS